MDHMRKIGLGLCILMVVEGRAQISRPLQDLHNFIRKDPPKITIDSTSFLDLFTQNSLHYLFPFYKGFLQEQEKKVIDTGMHYNMLAEAAAFTGDMTSVLHYEKAGYEKLPDSVETEIRVLAAQATTTHYTDARQYLLNETRLHRVVMLNEAENKPQTRIFATSLLQDLYLQGFRYLALDMLDNRHNKATITINALTGFYVNDPLAAEMIRKAIAIGYTLVPYEDTFTGHTINQREYAQAENLYHFLSAKDSTTKLLVIAGYGHIAKGAISDKKIPMAAYFKIISGIDPFTIDQTEMTENSTSAYGALMYDYWNKKKPISSPVIALEGNKAVDPFGFHLYDLHVIHPPMRYQDGRPLWMTRQEGKKETAIVPAYRTLFLVQAYYDKEYTQSSVKQAIPADQTYSSAQNGIYYLFLYPGKYKIVYRDKAYKILGTHDLEVK